MKNSDASLERLLGVLEAHNPDLVRLLQAKTEDEFIDAAEGGIERAIRVIEGGAKNYVAHKERGLSRLLSDFLNLAGFHATAERDNNGHVDVVIEHAFGGRWKYLGECKVYKGYQYHVDGCEQVLRYCSGRELRVFCLDFFKTDGAFDKMKQLRADFDDNRPLSQSTASSGHRIEGAFVTAHLHRSGRDVAVLHLCCSLA